MELINSFLNVVVPPASLFMLAFSWPALSFISACEWIYNSFNTEDMEDKVVIITGASSGIGEVLSTLPLIVNSFLYTLFPLRFRFRKMGRRGKK